MNAEVNCKLGETWCDAMTERLEDMANSRKGLTTIVLTSRTTGNERLAGIAHRKNAKDRGLMLNYCPWCGEPIEESAIDYEAKKKAGVQA